MIYNHPWQGMRTSSYLEQTLSFEQNPAIDQYFEDRASQLFEPKEDNSCLEIHVQRPHPEQSNENWNLVQKSELKHDIDCDSVPSSPVDCLRYSREGPPRYVPWPGLKRQKVLNAKGLEEIASASKKCFRVCFIQQRHSYSRLLVTRELFEELMSQFAIFPRFREFVLLFGAKHGENDVGPPQLRFRRMVAYEEEPGCRLSTGFEIAYGLRYAELNNRSNQDPWSIRQTAIYHKYKTSDKSSSWVMIAASKRAETSLDRYIKSCKDMAQLNPFEIHLIIIDTAMANWRPYIVGLTERITQHTDRVLVASIDQTDPLQLADFEERQRLKDFEDRLIDLLLIFDANYDTLTSLLDRYQDFCINCHSTSEDGDRRKSDFIVDALQEKQKDIYSSRNKIKTLHTKVRGTTSLLSSLLDHGNGSSLKQLAEEAKKENFTMRQLTEKSTKDAAAVKVLTVITLIYLPATVVSNFFSTQFVSQEQNQGGSFRIVVSANAWVFAAISIPLTLATLAVWWIWIRYQTWRSRRPERSTGPSAWKTFFASRRVVRRTLKQEA